MWNWAEIEDGMQVLQYLVRRVFSVIGPGRLGKRRRDATFVEHWGSTGMLESAGNSWSLTEAAHLLNRAGFGGTPEQIRSMHRLGRIAAVDFLLEPGEALSAFPVPTWAERAQVERDFKAQQAARRNMQQELRGLSEAAAEERRRAFNQKEQELTQQRIHEAQHWWFLRMLRTNAPLREKMTLFWHDHFATSSQKVRQPVYLVWQNEQFRKHALGSFEELTTAMVVDPALMLYLDSENSRKLRPNENFARELFELFTLGVGHYRESDIRQAARAFTGYQINRETGEVILNRKQHDAREKTVLGTTANMDAQQVVQVIFSTRRPAEFLVGKLWEFFMGRPASAEVVSALADGMRRQRHQLKPTLRRLFLSRAFYAPRVVRNQIKSPIQFLVQLLRQLELPEPPEGFPLQGQQQLGQVLFMPPNVAGWNWGRAWINTNTLLARYNLTQQLTRPVSAGPHGKGRPGKPQRNMHLGVNFARLVPAEIRQNPEAIVDWLCFRFFQVQLPAAQRACLVEFAAIAKQRPFTDADVGELCHLMLSTPDYQLT